MRCGELLNLFTRLEPEFYRILKMKSNPVSPVKIWFKTCENPVSRQIQKSSLRQLVNRLRQPDKFFPVTIFIFPDTLAGKINRFLIRRITFEIRSFQ